MSSAPRDDNVVFLSFRGAHTGAAICDTINLWLIFFEPAVRCKSYFFVIQLMHHGCGTKNQIPERETRFQADQPGEYLTGQSAGGVQMGAGG